jgi:hypothetical protein
MPDEKMLMCSLLKTTNATIQGSTYQQRELQLPAALLRCLSVPDRILWRGVHIHLRSNHNSCISYSHIASIICRHNRCRRLIGTPSTSRSRSVIASRTRLHETTQDSWKGVGKGA